MSRRANLASPKVQARRIKEGRGQKTKGKYRGYLDSPDVPSTGLRHRTWSPKFKLLAHSMSDGELADLYLAEDREDVVACYPQWALLPLSETQEIATQHEVNHPRPPGAMHDIIMTEDHLWVVEKNGRRLLQPRSVKVAKAVDNERVLQKHRIAQVYWGRRRNALPHQVVTKESISTVFVRNWALVRSTLRAGFFKHSPKNIVRRVDRCLRPMAQAGRCTLGELTDHASRSLGVHRADILPAIHYLIASHTWRVALDAHLLGPSQTLKFIKRT